MLVPQPSSHPHERIGRYEVLRKIATGGMAELFLAKQVGMEGFEKVVAIKRILAHLAFDEEFINMFRDEARIVAKLSHPNIVQIYDLGKSDDTYFIAMEYIPGRNLSSVAKKAKAKGEKLPPEFIARCIAQACEGLYYAHTRQDIDGRPLKIVHRDVSPQNIILAFSGGVKLVDFGIAKAATKIAHTRAGVLKGKYAYMSPEQIRGDEVDARSDLFAVGIVLYELLCGRRPFEKENSIQTLKAIVQEPHVDCRVLNSDIPDGLAAIIDKALSKSWVDRWQSAQELQLALEDLVAGTGRRCNNIVISKWVTDLFAEELSRDRGGTMVFKGVGEVILPDLDERAEEKKEAEGEPAPEDAAEGSADSSPLERGRGGGSVNVPVPRPPIPAPSTALGDLSSGRRAVSGQRDLSGRQALIEEGVIDHPVRERDDGGWTDDKTALATEEPPNRSSDLLHPVETSEQVSEPMDLDSSPGHDYSEPELDRPINKGPALYDDSKTEFGADLVPDEDIEALGEDADGDRGDEAAGDDEVSRDVSLDATWIPSAKEVAELKARAQSEVTGDEIEARPNAGEETEDPWEDKTIGYPDGKAPVDDDEAESDDGQVNTKEMSLFVPPSERDAPRREVSVREAQGWGNLEAEKRDGEVDLWDDKTATNDAYLEDDMLASPMVQTVDGADPTINAMSLSSDVLRAMAPTEEELSGEATMRGLNLADQSVFADPQVSDQTIAGMAPAIDDDEDEEPAAFDGEGETRRSLDDEPELPVPRSNKNVDLDSRTVAGVTSDFVLSGLPPPEPTEAYDASAGFEIDLSASQAEPPEAPKPKPKRNARGVGAIKLAKAPLEAPSVRARSKAYDFSEESTEAGESAFDQESTSSKAPEPRSWELEPSLPDTRPPPDSRPERPKLKSKSDVHEARDAKLIEQAFDDFSLEDDVPPKAETPKNVPVRGASSIMSAKIPPPLNAPPPTAQGPAAIGSTNVPPANLSLSEMLSIPIAQGSTRSGFQVYARAPAGTNPPAAASGAPVQPLRGRTNSMRQIRETVRAADSAPAPEPVLRMPAPTADPSVGAMISPGFQAGPPVLDFGAMQPEPPPRQRTRLWMLIGLLLAIALAAVISALVVPMLITRDPQLTIRTTPDGAEIYLNGQLQPAKTPTTLAGLQPGVTYELKLVHEGYEPVSKAVPIPRNTRNILVQIPLRAITKE